MNRLLVATTGVLLLAVPGCAPTEEPPKRECQLEAFDLSACDRSGLASVKAEGIWHVNVSLDNRTTPGAMRLLPDSGLLFGTPLTESQVEGDTFFLGSDYQDSYMPMRFALAGCQAPAPDRVKGEFRRCADGEADLKGTFEAVRVTRLAGEQEKSGVELVWETALPRGVAVDVFVAGGYAYVTALSDGLFIYDVRDPAVAPRKVAEVAPRNDVWHHAWVRDQTLYVSSNNEGILVYDVSKPEAPRRLRALPIPGVEVWGLYEAAIADVMQGAAATTPTAADVTVQEVRGDA